MTEQLRHGLSYTPEYRAWQTARHRCTCETSPAWADYGGRGIRMCDRWLNSPEAFLADVGPRPTPRHEIDREDNDGHYEPGNVRWVERPINSRNRRSNRFVEINGESLTIAGWAERSGVERSTIAYRLRAGWEPAAAVGTAAREKSPKGRAKHKIKHACSDCPELTRGQRCRPCENRHRAQVHRQSAEVRA